jgi:hypothetical protein
MSGFSKVFIKSTEQQGTEFWVIDLPGGSQKPGAEIILYLLKNGVNQFWELRDTGEQSNGVHYYNIISNASGQALTVTATPGAGVGARVFQAGLGNFDTQKWAIGPGLANTFIVNKFSGLVLDIQGGNLSLGTPIITFTRNSSTNDGNQRWDVFEVS